ncbi:FeS cluster assembly protein SufD [Vibrio stylophorae]|uniref:FeS cluster assembly protein SufD n=1 Tax=Vibrio stylophorae TaxID=659351 RepID=A0ABM8ZY20_9VIBR|nr:Fe-S cluster assembly protein SufD [Vibrio stylophorae]CAH0535750.1 FeS cluster assembly protein SufD [Vibrio stylophorae]
MAGSLSSNKAQMQPLASLEQLVAQSASYVWQQAAAQKLFEQGLPERRAPQWQHTSLSDLLVSPIHPCVSQTLNHDLFAQLNLPVDGYRLVFFDGQYQVRLSDWISHAKVTVLNELDDLQGQSLRDAISEDALSLLVDAVATAGAYIQLPSEKTLDKPIYLIHINSGNCGEMCAYRHHVCLHAGAKATVIEHHLSLNGSGGASVSRLTMDLAKGSHCDHIKLVEAGENQQHFAHNDIQLAASASAKSHLFLLSGKLIRHQTSSRLAGENGNASMNTLALPIGTQRIETRTLLEHQAAHCESEQLHKLIGQGQSQSVFDGMIWVSPDALKTNGQMDNHNLLLSEDARILCQPKLEIYADDVKCSHGATTGEIDPEQLFYLQARGIERRQAEQMLIHAFAADVVLSMNHDKVREHVLARVTELLGGGDA